MEGARTSDEQAKEVVQPAENSPTENARRHLFFVLLLGHPPL